MDQEAAALQGRGDFALAQDSIGMCSPPIRPQGTVLVSRRRCGLRVRRRCGQTMLHSSSGEEQRRRIASARQAPPHRFTSSRSVQWAGSGHRHQHCSARRASQEPGLRPSKASRSSAIRLWRRRHRAEARGARSTHRCQTLITYALIQSLTDLEIEVHTDARPRGPSEHVLSLPQTRSHSVTTKCDGNVRRARVDCA